MKPEQIKLPRTRTEAQAASRVRKVLTNGARDVEARFTEPDDDWEPIWLVATQDTGYIVAPGNVTAQDKHVMVEAVAAFARQKGAVCVGHLHSSWMVWHQDMTRERMDEVTAQMEANAGSTEGIPERREVLLLAVHTASRSSIAMADITRHDGAPPTLAAFRQYGDGGNFAGAMVDPIHDALIKLG